MKLFACLRTVIIGVLLLLSYACHHQFTTGTSHSLSFGLWCQMLLWMNKNPLGMWNNKEIQCVLIFVLCILLTNTIMLRNRKETWRGLFLQNKYRVLRLNWYPSSTSILNQRPHLWETSVLLLLTRLINCNLMMFLLSLSKCCCRMSIGSCSY